MKYFFSILIIITLSVSSYGQDLTDSIYFYQQSQKDAEVLFLNATNLNSSGIYKAGIAGFQYQNTKGHFRRAQEAESKKVLKIATSGIATLGKFKTSGYFNFSRVYQDSLSWTTKGTEIDAQPYYFASSKAGEFERTLYDFGGILSYDLIKDKLSIASGLEYKFSSSTRSVDPRPSVQNALLILKPELIFRTNGHSIGLQALWGYGKERFSLVFKNRDFGASLGYPDRINYIIYGYGLIENMQSPQNTVRNERYKGAALNYATNFTSGNLKATIGYKQWHDDNSFRTINSITNNLIGTFILDEITGNILANHVGSEHMHQISVNVLSASGQDKQVLYNSTNYRYDHQTLDAEYLIRFHHQRKKTLELGASLNYDKLEKQDIVSAHYVQNTKVEPGLSAGMYFKNQNKDLFSVYLAGGYIIPFNGGISVAPLQETVFTRGVIYPNYTYDSSKAVRLSGKLNYISSSLFKEFKTGFSVQASYLSVAQLGEQFSNATFLPSKGRLNLNLAVNLYF